MTNGVLSSRETRLPDQEEQCCVNLPEFSLQIENDRLPLKEESEGLFTLLAEEETSPLSKKEEDEEKEPVPVLVPLDGKILISNTQMGQIEQTAPLGLSVEVQALFDKIASSMILTHSSGDTETLLYLDSPQFASSVFYGTKITIKEFSTAPKAFTVEIATSSLGLNRIDLHKGSLLTAFREGNFGFSVARLDTHLQDDDPYVFVRKESVSEDKEEGGP